MKARPREERDAYEGRLAHLESEVKSRMYRAKSQFNVRRAIDEFCNGVKMPVTKAL